MDSPGAVATHLQECLHLLQQLAEAPGARARDQRGDEDQPHGGEVPSPHLSPGRQMTQGLRVWGGDGGLRGQEEGHSVVVNHCQFSF